jgi:hypothetical protein
MEWHRTARTFVLLRARARGWVTFRIYPQKSDGVADSPSRKQLTSAQFSHAFPRYLRAPQRPTALKCYYFSSDASIAVKAPRFAARCRFAARSAFRSDSFELSSIPARKMAELATFTDCEREFQTLTNSVRRRVASGPSARRARTARSFLWRSVCPPLSATATGTLREKT